MIFEVQTAILFEQRGHQKTNRLLERQVTFQQLFDEVVLSERFIATTSF